MARVADALRAQFREINELICSATQLVSAHPGSLEIIELTVIPTPLRCNLPWVLNWFGYFCSEPPGGNLFKYAASNMKSSNTGAASLILWHRKLSRDVLVS